MNSGLVRDALQFFGHEAKDISGFPATRTKRMVRAEDLPQAVECYFDAFHQIGKFSCRVSVLST